MARSPQRDASYWSTSLPNTVRAIPSTDYTHLRLLAVGCGRVFERYHLPAILASPTGPAENGVELVGACETDDVRRRWAQESLRVPSTSRVGDIPQGVRADAALVSTPPDTHAQLVEALLDRGLHVLVEKPMTTSLEEADRLVEAQRRSGMVLRVGFNRRYRRSYAVVRDRARDARAVDHIDFTFVADARRWNPGAAPPDPAFLLHDAGSHALDLVAFVGGAPLARVRASPAGDGVEHLVIIDAELANGTHARCVIGHAPRFAEMLAVKAGRSTFRADSSGHGIASRVAIAGQLAVRKLTGRPTPTDESFRAQLAGFAAACQRRGDDVGADCHDGRAAALAVEGCLTSISSGATWTDLLHSPTITSLS